MKTDAIYSTRVSQSRLALVGCALGCIATALTVCAGPLTAPTPRQPLPGSVNVDPRSVDLKWTKVTGATSYEWRLLRDGNVARSGTVSADVHFVNLDNLKYDTDYAWRVRAWQGTAAGRWMDPAPRFGTFPKPSPVQLLSPADGAQSLGTVSGGKAKVRLSWAEVPGMATYTIVVSKTRNGVTLENELRMEVAGSSAEVLLDLGFSYTWKVNGHTQSLPGLGVLSTGWSVPRSFGTITPSAPQLTSPLNNQETTGAVTFQWTQVPGATQYRLLIKSAFNSVQEIKAWGTSALVSSLPRLGYYTWTVVAVTPSGEYTSGTASFLYMGSKIVTQQGYSIGGSVVRLCWKRVEGACWYRVSLYYSCALSPEVLLNETYRGAAGMDDHLDLDLMHLNNHDRNTGLCWRVQAIYYPDAMNQNKDVHCGPLSDCQIIMR